MSAAKTHKNNKTSSPARHSSGRALDPCRAMLTKERGMNDMNNYEIKVKAILACIIERAAIEGTEKAIENARKLFEGPAYIFDDAEARFRTEGREIGRYEKK